MKKINKKGFTLIELLAVIVVLALIMVLVLPNVMDSMNSAKQQTFLLYANRMLSAAMDKRASDELVGTASNCYKISELNSGNTTKYNGVVEYVTDESGNGYYKIQMYDNNTYQIGCNTVKVGEVTYDKAGGVTSAEIEDIKTKLHSSNRTLVSASDSTFPTSSCTTVCP